MNRLDRYLGRAVLSGASIALLALTAVTAFFAFLGELGDLGKGSGPDGQGGYGLGDALLFTWYVLPRITYEMFPMAALLGSLLGLGALASNSELIVMRAVGLSIGRIVRAATTAGLLLMLLAVAIGEGLAPISDRMAQTVRNQALSETVSFRGRLGYWVRDGRDFVNIRELAGPEEIRRITLFRFNAALELEHWIEAERAVWSPDGTWMLESVRDSRISPEGVEHTYSERMPWASGLLPDMINVAVAKPETLAIWELRAFVRYFENNGQDASRFELAFWKKLILPLSSIVMVMLAVPFVFGSLRDTGTGQRILVGMLVGIGFHIANSSLSNLGLLQGVPPLWSAASPTLLFFAGGLIWIRRIR